MTSRTSSDLLRAATKGARLGLGTAMLTLMDHGEAQTTQVICAALDAGIRLVDTAAAYCPSHDTPGYGERLVAGAVREWAGPRHDVIVSTKGGHYRAPTDFPIDGRPEFLRAACEGSLRALGVESIGLYFLHWPDPNVPIAESAGALSDLMREGKIRSAGLSNVTVDQLNEGLTACDIAAVQNPFSPDVPDDGVVKACDALGIAFTAYSPLGGGGHARSLGERHPAFAQIAAHHGVSPQRVTLAWEMALSDVLIPLTGATQIESLRDSVAAAELKLSTTDVARLSEAVGLRPDAAPSP